jgi:arylsulfatase A-like enzyme
MSAVLAVPFLVSCNDAPIAATRPNVVLLVMETTRADRCSVNGYARPTTPRLEALAREGVRFTNALASAPWTAPSHATLFTGLRPEHHGGAPRRRRPVPHHQAGLRLLPRAVRRALPAAQV